MDFRDYLKSFMNEKGIEAADLAEAVGYSRAYMYDLLKGARRFNETVEQKICAHLGIEKVYK